MVVVHGRKHIPVVVMFCSEKVPETNLVWKRFSGDPNCRRTDFCHAVLIWSFAYDWKNWLLYYYYLLCFRIILLLWIQVLESFSQLQVSFHQNMVLRQHPEVGIENGPGWSFEEQMNLASFMCAPISWTVISEGVPVKSLFFLTATNSLGQALSCLSEPHSVSLWSD